MAWNCVRVIELNDSVSRNRTGEPIAPDMVALAGIALLFTTELDAMIQRRGAE
jgi:hypothetical protein